RRPRNKTHPNRAWDRLYSAQTRRGDGVSATPSAMRGSVRARLMVWNVITVAILLGILGAIIHYSAQAILLTSVDHDLAVWDRSFAEAPNPGRRPPGPPPGGPGTDFAFEHGPPPRREEPGRGPEGGPHFRPLNEKDLSERAKAAFWPRLLDPE